MAFTQAIFRERTGRLRPNQPCRSHDKPYALARPLRAVPDIVVDLRIAVNGYSWYARRPEASRM
jgi:hypothetical protein